MNIKNRLLIISIMVVCVALGSPLSIASDSEESWQAPSYYGNNFSLERNAGDKPSLGDEFNEDLNWEIYEINNRFNSGDFVGDFYSELGDFDLGENKPFISEKPIESKAYYDSMSDDENIEEVDAVGSVEDDVFGDRSSEKCDVLTVAVPDNDNCSDNVSNAANCPSPVSKTRITIKLHPRKPAVQEENATTASMVDEDGKAVVEIEKEDNYASSDKFRVRLKLPLQNKIIATNTNTDDNEDARGGKLLRKKTRKTANKTKVIGEDKNDDVPVTKAQARVKATQKEKVRSTHDEDLNNHKNPLRKKKSPKSKKLGENHAIKKRKRSAASSSAEQPPKKAKMLSKEERVEQRINFLNDYLSEHDMSKYVLAKAIGIGTSSIVKLFDKSAVIGPRVAEKLAVYFKKDRGFFCVGKETETLAIEEEGGTSYKGADFIKQHLIKHGLRKSEFLKNLGYMFGNGYLGRILKGESQISERFAKVLGKYFDCSYKDFIREEDFSNEKKKEKRLSSKKDMEYVEAHRKSIPMTKTDFSKELGMTIQHYSLISTGDREVTRPTAKKLAVYFKCDVDDFMPAYDVASSTKTGVDFLKDYMKKTRIKQPELSSKIGITQAQLNAIVLGQNPITKMMAIRFAQYFECSTHVFLED